MTALPHDLSVLRNATLPDGSVVDVELAAGIVQSVTPADATRVSAGESVLDLEGFMLLTAPAEPHAHLDKALSYDLIAPPAGDLVKAIESWRAYSGIMTVSSIADRAREQALSLVRNGTTAVRCHVDMLLGDEPLRGVHALLQVREELAELIDIELVALPGPDIPDEIIEAALDAGFDTVGGAPHLAENPLDDLRRLLAIAERRGLPVDIHTDEDLNGEPTMIEFARIVRDWTVPVSAGHCVRLGTLESGDLDEIIREVLASDIGIITLPITNLYLQGWENPVATPRGITALRALLDAGVRVAAGADNVRDPFNPVGRSDALETVSLLVTAGHLSLEEAYAAVSDGARSVMALPKAGAVVGANAELLAVRGRTLSEVVAVASPDRFVIKSGRLIARSSAQYDIATPTISSAPVEIR